MQSENAWSVLAGSALNNWRSSKYAESLELLKKLRDQLESNPNAASNSANGNNETKAKTNEQSIILTEAKIKHNIALASFAALNHGNLNNINIVKELKDLLIKLSQVEDTILRNSNAIDEGEVGNSSSLGEGENQSVTTKDNADRKGPSKVNVSTSASLSSNFSGFEVDASLGLYNQAVILVYMQQYRSAMKILEGLFRYIEAVDENVALGICFLLLEIYSQIRTNACAKGATGGEGSSTDKSGNTASVGSKPVNGTGAVARVIDKAQQVVDFLEKPHVFNGLSTDGESSEEVAGGNEDGKNSHSRDVAEFKFRLHMYKARLRALEGKVKASRKEVKSALEIYQHELKDSKDNSGLWLGYQLGSNADGGIHSSADTGFNTPALCLKANLEYLRSNHRKAIKLLESCSSSGLDKGIYFNNMGCIHHILGQHRCASMYFARSLDAYQTEKQSSAQGTKKRQRNVSAQPCVYNVLLNSGVQLLHTGRPKMAYSCFQEAALSNYHKPRLWMYIAECVCIAHEQYLQEHFLISDTGSLSSVAARRLTEGSTGDASSHRYILDPCGSGIDKDIWAGKSMLDCGPEDADHLLESKKENESRHMETQTLSGSLSLESGLRATSNVLFLLDEARPDMGFIAAICSEAKKKSNTDGKAQTEADNEDTMSAEGSLLAIGQTTLLCRAYLALWMNNWAVAQQAGLDALKLLDVGHVKDCKSISIAHTYVAESCFRQGKLKEGMEHAMHALEKQDELATRNQGEENMAKALRCAMCVNVATARISMGDTQEAIHSIHKALQYVPHSREAIRALLFVYLKQGNVDKALEVLKREMKRF